MWPAQPASQYLKLQRRRLAAPFPLNRQLQQTTAPSTKRFPSTRSGLVATQPPSRQFKFHPSRRFDKSQRPLNTHCFPRSSLSSRFAQDSKFPQPTCTSVLRVINPKTSTNMSASVDSVTAQLATTSLDNSAAETAGTQPTTAENDAVLASAAEGRRLYIGNLAYATTEGELKDFFKDYLVESVTIPTNPRTSRPVGYAFVALSTPTEAERAIAELNSKPILERKVSIQLARTPEAHAEGAGSGAEGGNETRRRSSTRGRGRGRGRGGRGGRGGRAKADGAEGAEHVELTDAAPADSAPTNVPGQVIPLTETTNEALTAEKGTEKKSAPRERKQRGPPEDGVPSKTKVMVANLPYDLKEDKLLEIFKDYSPTAAKIALRPIPRFMVKKLQARGEPRKGRGFGFVTLGSEELQKKACEEMNGKEIEGREIAVKVAIDSPGKEDDHDGPTDGEEAAASSTEAAPAEKTETPAAAPAAA